MSYLKKAFGMIKEKRIETGLFLVTMLVAFLPLFSVNCIGGHDIEYHLLRIESLKEGILMGCPFLRVNVLFFGGRGYASSLFYPDFLLYFPAALRAMGVSIAASYHLFIALCILLSYLAMHFCMRKMTDNTLIATLAAVLYTLAPYHLHDIYTRSAVGEFTAYIFLPFLMLGLYEMVFSGLRRPATLVVGFSGVLLCHTNTTVLVVCLYVVAFLIALPRLLKNKNELQVLFLSAIGVLILTAFYWIPLLEMLTKESFQTGAGGFDLNYEKLMMKDLVSGGYKGMGIVMFIPSLARLLVSQKDLRKGTEGDRLSGLLRFADLSFLAGILFCLGSTGFLPWARLQNVLGFVQFPWRLLIVASVLLSVSGAIYTGLVFEKKDLVNAGGRDFGRKAVVLFLVAMLLINSASLINGFDQPYYSYSNDYYSHIPYTGNVIGGEWLPTSVTDRDALVEDCDIAIFPDGTTTTVTRDKNALWVTVPEGTDYVDVPFIYYLGYSAQAEDGTRIAVTGEAQNGQCRVLTKGRGGRILVYYRGTSLQRFTSGLSGICFLAVLFALIKRVLDKVLGGKVPGFGKTKKKSEE